MKMVRNSLLVLGVAGMLFAATTGENCGGSGMEKGGMHNKQGMFQEKMAKDLGLSKEQSVKIKEIMGKYKESDQGCPDVMDSRKELIEELESSNPSEQKIKELKKNIVAGQEKRLDDMINMKKEIKSVLTREQIEKLKKLEVKRKQHDGKRKKHDKSCEEDSNSCAPAGVRGSCSKK